MKEKKNNNRGFTLVELIIVIVILAILVGVSIGGIYSWVGRARKNKVMHDCKVMEETLETLIADSEFQDTVKYYKYFYTYAEFDADYRYEYPDVPEEDYAFNGYDIDTNEFEHFTCFFDVYFSGFASAKIDDQEYISNGNYFVTKDGKDIVDIKRDPNVTWDNTGHFGGNHNILANLGVLTYKMLDGLPFPDFDDRGCYLIEFFYQNNFGCEGEKLNVTVTPCIPRDGKSYVAPTLINGTHYNGYGNPYTISWGDCERFEKFTVNGKVYPYKAVVNEDCLYLKPEDYNS